MADDNLRLMDLTGELKNLRRFGFYGYIHNALVLQEIMNCEDAPPEYMASCFVWLVRHYIPDPARSELLLATVGLLGGFDSVDSTKERYKKFYADFIKPTKTLADPESSLHKRSNALIDVLAKYILRENNLGAIIVDAPQTFELPESQQNVSAPSYDIFVDELGYYEREWVKLPEKKKKWRILFIKFVGDLFYAAIAFFALIGFILPASFYNEFQRFVFFICFIVGGPLIHFAIGRVCEVLFGYKKKPRTKKNLLIRIWRKFWD